MRKKTKAAAGLSVTVLTVALAAGFPLTVCAGGTSPRFARTEEEWEKLEDDLLLWEEINDLVMEYNLTVKINHAYYNSGAYQSKNSRQSSDTLLGMADDYDALADACDSADESADAVKYRLSAEQLRQEAEENVSDSEVLYLENLRTAKGIILQAEQLFVRYYQDLARQAAAQESVEYLEKFLGNKKESFQAGRSSETDVLKAEENLRQEEMILTGCESALRQDYKTLITLCGWEYSSETEIGPMPEYSPETAALVNTEEDLRKAVENNLKLKTDDRKYKNSKGLNDAAITEKWAVQKKSDEDSVKAAYQNAYRKLKDAEAAYANAGLSCQLRKKSCDTAEQKKELGRLSEMEVLEMEREWKTAEGEKTALWYDLILARIGYDAVVGGYTE